jgi:hypothetical protein
VAATLNDVKNRLAGEYAIQHNVLADIYEGIEKIPDDFLLSPIGEARTEEGKLINPFDLDLFDEIDAETQ